MCAAPSSVTLLRRPRRDGPCAVDAGLEVDSLVVQYGDRRAVDGISFAVRPGRITGFVGGNGAGKTSTMRVVLGLARAAWGEVRWNGRSVTAADRRGFGYMPEERGLYPAMTVADQLAFLGRLHGLPGAAARARAVELLRGLGLAGREGEQLQRLSLGNQQRVQLAAALVQGPGLLVLDEPFSGLDPLAVDTMASVVQERAAAGVPVLFSSHQLDLVERLCDDVVVLHHGRVVASGPVERLLEQRCPHYTVVLEGDAGWLGSIPDLRVLQLQGSRAVVELSSAQDAQLLLRRLLAVTAVHVFAPVAPTLADRYRELVQ